MAEAIASRLATPVTYLAAGGIWDDPGAEETAAQHWQNKIDRHRQRRPRDWQTVEIRPGEPLAGIVAKTRGGILIDSIGPWMAGCNPFDSMSVDLLGALGEREGWSVVVTDEVGLGVHPPTAAGIEFRDAMGEMNRSLAAMASCCYFVVAGRALSLDQAAFEVPR